MLQKSQLCNFGQNCGFFINSKFRANIILYYSVSSWIKSTQHRPADVLSNTLSQAQSSRCSKVKNLRKNRNWIRKWKKAVSILGDWTFFSPDWRRSFHSPYILKGKSVFCDWLECLLFYIVHIVCMGRCTLINFRQIFVRKKGSYR